MKRTPLKIAVLAGLFAMVSLLWPMVALADSPPPPCFELEHADQVIDAAPDETIELIAAAPAPTCWKPAPLDDKRVAAAPLPALFGLRLPIHRSPDLHRPPDPNRMQTPAPGLSR